MQNVSGNRKAQIIEVASRLISEKGYHAASMRDLAEMLNIEAASLYNHIASKEEILHHICFDMASQFINSIQEVNDIYFNGEDKLRMLVRQHVLILTDNLDKAQVFLREWRHLSEANKTEFIALRDRYEQGIIEVLQTGELENLFLEVDKKFAALNILSSLNWIVEWYKPNGKMTPQAIGDKLCQFILTGLKKRTPF